MAQPDPNTEGWLRSFDQTINGQHKRLDADYDRICAELDKYSAKVTELGHGDECILHCFNDDCTGDHACDHPYHQEPAEARRWSSNSRQPK